MNGFVLLLFISQVSGSTIAAGLGDRPFSVEAERLTAEKGSGRYRAEGQVVVRRAGATLFADVVVFDQATGIAIADGHVTAVEGDSVLSCDHAEMKIPELLGGITQGELRIKKKGTLVGSSTLTAAASRRGGSDELIIEAEVFERTEPRVFNVSHGSFTACDCGDDEAPTWRIRSSTASVDLDAGAWLTWPVFYVKDVPILALPIYYVPLGSRRTGVLAPHFSTTPVTGPVVSVPFFFAFDRSWDATLEPNYRSTRGPGLGLELRYRPTTETSGTWKIDGLVDFGDPNGEGGFSKTRDDAIKRYGLAGRHVTDFEEMRLHAEVNLLGDPRLQADFADAFLTRQQEYAQSRATLTQTSKRFRIAGGVQWLQDLRPYRYSESDVRETSLLSNDESGAGAIRQRAAELRLDAVPYPLTSVVPLLGAAKLSIQAFGAPARVATRFVRADFRPEIRAPFDILGIVVEPWAAARVTVWSGATATRTAAANRQAIVAGTRLFADLTRSYGDYFHRIRPSIEYAVVPGLGRGGDDVFETFDEIDLLRRVSQARLRLMTDLVRTADGSRIAALDVWFGGDLGLPGRGSEGASEIVGTPYLSFAPSSIPLRFDLNALVAYDPNRSELMELLAGISARTNRGDALSVSFGELSGSGPPRHTFVAPEELVPSRTIDRSVYLPRADYLALSPEQRVGRVPWSPFRGLYISAQVRPFEPLTLGFDITMAFSDDSSSTIRTTRGLVKWDSPCECLTAYATIATAPDREGFSFDFGLDLARLGSVSSR